MHPQHKDSVAVEPLPATEPAGVTLPWDPTALSADELARIKARVATLRSQIDPLYAELRALEQLQLEAESPVKVNDEIEWTPTTGTRTFRGVVFAIFRSGDMPAYRARLKYRDGTIGEAREVFHWYNPRRIEAA